MDSRPFRILGVQQIAIGGPDKERLRRLWVDIFGLAVKSTFVSERENVRGEAPRCALDVLSDFLAGRLGVSM